MMRCSALLSLVLALGLTGCPDKDDVTTLLTDTNNLTTGTDQTTGTPDTTTGTPDPTTGGTVGETGTSTVDPGTSTVDPGTSTVDPGTSTVDPSATTTPIDSDSGSDGNTTEPPAPGEAYGPCSNDMANPIPCAEGDLCIDAVNTGGEVMGAFCSPQCMGPANTCATPQGAEGVQGNCLFGPMGMDPVQCALICNLAMDTCPNGATCEDIGIPEQMGMKFGICTHM